MLDRVARAKRATSRNLRSNFNRSDILPRRCSKHPPVLATELRGTLVTDAKRDFRGIEGFGE
jgi:hypothetical protein